MRSLANRADSIDEYWGRFRTSCRPAGTFTGGDREWFAVWDRLATVDPCPDSPDRHGSFPPYTDLVIGTTFANRYEIVDALGEGASGEVWRAMDTHQQRLVALKTFFPGSSFSTPLSTPCFMVLECRFNKRPSLPLKKMR